MKIAFATQDGINISKHFGRAPYYLVVSVEDGAETAREMRDKANHAHVVHDALGSSGAAQAPHGFSPEEQNLHFQMAAAISDCATLVCGGMGNGAYINLNERGIKPLLTDVDSIDEALKAYLSGTLIDRAAGMLH
jgi:predicted Fe-Mo cluster-binding NifX family protein